MSMPSLLHKGSVKDILGEKNGKELVFSFSDRYSIYDWGEMPDHIPHKGETLAMTSWLFFNLFGDASSWENWGKGGNNNELLNDLRKTGVRHHALALVDQNMKDVDGSTSSKYLKVKAVDIVKPQYDSQNNNYDYSEYQKRPVNALVPLEVIFRFGIPQGSSLLKRANDVSYCREIGIEKTPSEGDIFDFPVIEFSTKLEDKDRYISYQQAKEISGMTDGEFGRLTSLVTLLSMRMKDFFQEIEVELWDGKFEFGFTEGENGERDFQLVDAIGPDELRLIYKGVQLSKEALRHIYRGTPWQRALERSKEMAKDRKSKEWKKICSDELKQLPKNLNAQQLQSIESMYKVIANELSLKFYGKELYSGLMNLDQIVNVIKGL